MVIGRNWLFAQNFTCVGGLGYQSSLLAEWEIRLDILRAILNNHLWNFDPAVFCVWIVQPEAWDGLADWGGLRQCMPCHVLCKCLMCLGAWVGSENVWGICFVSF